MSLKNLFSRTLRHFLVRYTSVWLRQRSTTLREKTSPSSAKQFFKSKFLLRQGKKASNADALRGFLTQYRRKFALKNRIEFKALQPNYITSAPRGQLFPCNISAAVCRFTIDVRLKSKKNRKKRLGALEYSYHTSI